MNTLILLAETATNEPGLSIWGMIVKGGWLMIPIFALSIIAVYIFFERYLLLRHYIKRNEEFIAKIKEHMLTGNSRAAINLCKEENLSLIHI